MTLTSVLLPTLFAGVVAVAVTVAVERFGGLLGGLLGTLPTTIVPAAMGIYDVASPSGFAQAMFAVAPGMFLNSLFLLVWGVLPPRLSSGPRGKLVWTLVVSLGVWGSGALALVLFVESRMTLSLALGAMITMLVAGLVATARSKGTPRAHRRVKMLVLASRGGAAATAIALAVVVASHGGEVAAGVVSVFPAIFLTTMVALRLSHGEEVPAGAVGPMMVGSTAVTAFALLATWTFPTLGPWLGSVVAWLVAAVAVQVPLFFLARTVVGRLAR